MLFPEVADTLISVTEAAVLKSAVSPTEPDTDTVWRAPNVLPVRSSACAPSTAKAVTPAAVTATAVSVPVVWTLSVV